VKIRIQNDIFGIYKLYRFQDCNKCKYMAKCLYRYKEEKDIDKNKECLGICFLKEVSS